MTPTSPRFNGACSITPATSGFSAVSSRVPIRYETQATFIAIGLGLLALPVAGAPSASLAGLAVAAFGLLVAPSNALRTQLLPEAVAPGRHSEAFAIQYSAFGIGWGISGLSVAALLGPVGAGGAIAIGGGTAVATSLGMEVTDRVRARRAPTPPRPA